MTKDFEVDIVHVDKWEAPEKIEGPDPRIICMSNVPKPLHSLAPRTIFGQSTWDHMRRRCYYLADYKCECCGREVGKDIEKRELMAHELYAYDFVSGTAWFVRCVALCPLCHIRGVHTGRMLTMYKKGSPFMTANMVLEGAEHAFSLVHEWNTKHPDEEPLRLYGTWIELLNDRKIGEEIQALVKKYDVKFYGPTKNQAEWSKWKLIIGTKEYPTPYKDEAEWQKKMEEMNKQINDRNYQDPFSGGVFDEIKKTLENG